MTPNETSVANAKSQHNSGSRGESRFVRFMGKGYDHAMPGRKTRIAKRRRPKDSRVEAVAFLGAALDAFDKRGLTTEQARLALPLIYNQFCRGTGLRGKQKSSVWCAVIILFNEANESAIGDAAPKE
jgi:hypothetical protein